LAPASCPQPSAPTVFYKRNKLALYIGGSDGSARPIRPNIEQADGSRRNLSLVPQAFDTHTQGVPEYD